MLQIRKASRKQAKIKLGLQGPSGSGKTMSALLIAMGLVYDPSKIVLIDTENGSGDLYSDLGDYNVLPLSPPFAPERFIEAIDACEKAGMECIIIDSISHEWEGEGGILSIHSSMTGNSFTNWSKITPRHNLFINKILHCNAHVITTIRTKQDYVLVEKSNSRGKSIAAPQKVGLKGVQRDGVDYELTLVLDIDIKHFATASKDRTNLFADKPEFIPTQETGKLILEWCNSGEKVLGVSDYVDLIMKAENKEAIKKIYDDCPFPIKKGNALYDAGLKRNNQLKEQAEEKQ